jgi:hypothetical protein
MIVLTHVLLGISNTRGCRKICYSSHHPLGRGKPQNHRDDPFDFVTSCADLKFFAVSRVHHRLSMALDGHEGLEKVFCSCAVHISPVFSCKFTRLPLESISLRTPSNMLYCMTWTCLAPRDKGLYHVFRILTCFLHITFTTIRHAGNQVS